MAPEAPIIEIATGVHADALAAIHATAFPPAELWSRDVMLLQLQIPATFGLMCRNRGMLLCRVAVDEAEILTLAVSPEQRRSGIGSALLRTATRRAATLGADYMFLEVAVTNHGARALYRSHGFNEVGLRRHYYTDGTDALVLRSTLTARTGKS